MNAKQPPGTPCWVDLLTSDSAAAAAFYSAVFGWELTVDEDPQYGGYGLFSKYGNPVAGIMTGEGDNPYKNVWTFYLAADDLDATSATAEAAGAQVMMPAMTVGTQGRMAVLADPAGAAFGLWQAGEHVGFDRSARAGTPVWFESMSRDYAKAQPFYGAVFGLQTQVQGDTDAFRYSVLARGEEQVAGIMDASGFLPEGVPSFWQFYVGTDDTDATLTAVLANGGTVEQPAENTPHGRMATVADPLGARFNVIMPPPS